MNGHEREEIDGFFNEVVDLLGDVKNDVPEDLLRIFYNRREWVALCKLIRGQCGLSQVKMKLLRRDTERYFENQSPAFTVGSQFFEQYELNIPNDNIAIVLDNKFLENAPFDAVVLAIADSMASIKLRSVGNPINRAEMSNIAAMVMGYSKCYVNGHKYGHSIEQIKGEQRTKSLIEKLKSGFVGNTEPVTTIEKMGLGSLSWDAVTYVRQKIMAINN